MADSNSYQSRCGADEGFVVLVLRFNWWIWQKLVWLMVVFLHLVMVEMGCTNVVDEEEEDDDVVTSAGMVARWVHWRLAKEEETGVVVLKDVDVVDDEVEDDGVRLMEVALVLIFLLVECMVEDLMEVVWDV